MSSRRKVIFSKGRLRRDSERLKPVRTRWFACIRCATGGYAQRSNELLHVRNQDLRQIVSVKLGLAPRLSLDAGSLIWGVSAAGREVPLQGGSGNRPCHHKTPKLAADLLLLPPGVPGSTGVVDGPDDVAICRSRALAVPWSPSGRGPRIARSPPGIPRGRSPGRGAQLGLHLRRLHRAVPADPRSTSGNGGRRTRLRVHPTRFERTNKVTCIQH